MCPRIRTKESYLQYIYRNKIIRYTGLSVVLVIVLALGGGGWYFSDVLEADGLRVDHSAPENSVVVTTIHENTVTLKQLPDVDKEERLSIPALWGLTDGINYGQLGAALSESDGQVTRELKLQQGVFQVGDELYLERTGFPHDPFVAQSLPFEEVRISGELGEMEAWYIPHIANVNYQDEYSDVWAIFVHGRTGNRAGTIRMLGSFGAHSLTIDYRNDEGAPASESGYYDFGTTEWRDVEAAVQYALDNGAKRIVLVGFSMGGGIVVNYQLKSDLSKHTIGIVLDAPMLNFSRTIDKGAQERSVPAPITIFAKLFSSLRFGVDWSDLDFLSHADELTVPILLIHGDNDDTVPIETSIEFAAAAPALVEFHTFEGAGHAEAWNWDRQRYGQLVRNFGQRIR